MPRSDVHSEDLPFAYKPEELPQLQGKVEKFFKDPQVVRATKELGFNVHEFRQKVCSPKYYPKTAPSIGTATYGEALTNLYAAANQSQKRIARRGGYRGMIATSQMCEQLGLLQRLREFKNEMEIVAAMEFAKPIEDATRRIRLHCAIALELREILTQGNYAEPRDSLKKITHGVQLGFEQIGGRRIPGERIRRGYSHGASDRELEDIWSYGQTNIEPRTLSDRIQGMRFRHMKLHEFGEQERGEHLTGDYPDLPHFFWHTITTESGGEGHLALGNRPAFFTGKQQVLKNTGPVHPEGLTINFAQIQASRTLDTQIQDCIDQIAELLYDYPKE